MKKKIYVLDVSGYLFRSYYALPAMTNAKGVATHALYGFIRSVLRIIKDFSPEYMVAVFDGPDGRKARLEIYPEYKSKRVRAPEDLPHQFDLAAQFCTLYGIPKLILTGVEADDTMGSVANWAAHHGYEVFLCTGDKDLCQLVGDNVYVLQTHKDNLVVDAKKVEEIYGVPPHLIVDYLALTGDASDNIPGLPGFGPKTAVQLLTQFHSLEELLSRATEVSGKKKQDLLLQEADVARMSKRLALIDTSLEVPHESDFYHVKPVCTQDLITFYEEYRFNALLKEMSVDVPLAATSSYKLINAIDELLAFKELCIDVETTDVDPMKAALVGIGFAAGAGLAWYMPASLENIEALRPLFKSSIKFFGHNIKYDLQVLASYGLRPKHVTFDTMIAAYLLSSETRSYSLEHLAMQYLGHTKVPFKSFLASTGKKTLLEVPQQAICDYCCLDADLTWQLKERLEKDLKERKLDKLLLDLEMPLLHVLLEMERKGIFVDVDVLKSLSEDVVEQITQLESKIYKMAGQSFNINSPKQLGDIFQNQLGIQLGKKTSTGQMSMSAEVLEELAHAHPIAATVLEYRSLEKLRSTYIDALPLEINPKTGRIHCTFNQTVAATGRLSCTSPNLQNIPVRTSMGREIRKAFRAEKEGWSLLSGDYSQIELRLLAHLSEDPNLLKAFENDEDIHAFTASLIFDVPLAQVTKEQRGHAKTVNFGIIYGQQAFGLSKELGISMKEAASFIESYFKRYPRVQAFLEDCKQKARLHGKAVTLMGRERIIPDMNSKNPTMRGLAERLAINTPLQGLAADLIKKAMLLVDARLKKEHKLSMMILQIHDELLFEAPDFELISLEELVREEMQGCFKLKVPLRVDIAIGKNWKEC